jgi:DNA-binding CsgD family transcriptional regulator
LISTRILCRPFVGRGDEVEHLAARRRAAGESHGGLVLIGGEPGIGKSRLLREFVGRLNRRSSALAVSACRAFAQQPLAPLLDSLGQIVEIDRSELIASSKEERLEAMIRRLEQVASKRVTVVAIEDLHWASVDLVQTLLVLAQHAASKRLLFVATYRDNEIVPAHPLFRWFGELVREPAVSVVTLPRLDDEETDRLISGALPERARLPAPVLRAVRERSDGNPLFAEELLRSAVDSQRSRTTAAPGALPLSLHALIRERLRDCSSEEVILLERASVFGRTFTTDGLTAVFGGDSADFEPMLERLRGLQLLECVEGAAGAYQFRHALTRDVVYGDMETEAVRPFHLAIAEHLERSHEAAGAPEELAHHFWQADRRDRAAAYYELAGAEAMTIFAYQDAAAFFERAAIGYDAPAARARVEARTGQAFIFAGDLDDGIAHYERAVALAIELRDVAQAVRSRALMAGHLFDGGRKDAAIALVRETLPLVADGNASLRARLLTRLAMMLARGGNLDDAHDALQQVDRARLEPGADATAEYYLGASELHALRAETAEWKSCFAQGLAIYESRGHPGPMQVAHANFAVQALAIGETGLARTHHRIARELARTLRFEDQNVLLAQVELYAGNLAEARRIVSATKPSRKFLMRAMQTQVAIPLALASGDDAMLEEYYEPAFLIEAGLQPFTLTLARVAAAQAFALAAKGRARDVRLLLGRVLDAMTTPFGMMLPIAAIARFGPERVAELRVIVASAAARPGDRVNKAFLALLDAVSASQRGESSEATRMGLDAASGFAELEWPLFEAFALELAGRLHAALAIYLRCGATGSARRLEVLGMGDGAGGTLGMLTARERELALLIAAGKPNRAAAAELSITEKAVEKYLTSIYAKFGLKSRSQLAALVASSQNRSER